MQQPVNNQEVAQAAAGLPDAMRGPERGQPVLHLKTWNSIFLHLYLLVLGQGPGKGQMCSLPGKSAGGITVRETGHQQHPLPCETSRSNSGGSVHTSERG